MENQLFDVFGFGNDRPSTIAGSTGDELLPGTIDIIPGGQGAIALEMQGSDLLGRNVESFLLGEFPLLDVTVANNEEGSLVLDIDRNGRLEALTDGIMMIRHLFGFAADIVVRDAVVPDGTRTDAAEISSYIDELGLLLDVDGDGQLTALTDGIMIIRDLFGFSGDIVIRDAVAPGAPRDTVSEVTAYLTELKSMTLTPEPPPPETLPVVEVSPANGEEMVNLTRETVVRFGEKVDPATVNDESFFLIANGERVGGRIDVSSTEEFATFFYDEPLPASTEVRVVVAGDEIIARDGNAIDADGDGNPGGTLTADFRTLPLTRIEGTDVSGFVFDSFNTNADGSNIPVVGATIRVDAFSEANAITDENGFFLLEDVPAPVFSVHIDGSTADNAPEGTVYATVGKLFESVPGQETQLTMDGETFDVFLPPMATGDIQELSETADTEVGFGDAGVAQLQELFPDVDASLWELTQVTFPPGSAQDEDGNAATQATIIPVDPERLPAPLPPGVELPLVISIQAGGDAGFSQAGGATNFDVPAPVSLPNVDGLAPGEQSLIWSFNHDSGDWEVIGTGTVSADGRTIDSDPGVGIRAPGWHGTAPGTQPDIPPPTPPDDDCQTPDWTDALKIVAAITDCLKDLSRVGAVLDALLDAFNSGVQLGKDLITLQESFQSGGITANELKAAVNVFRPVKDTIAATVQLVKSQNPVQRTLDAVACITGLANAVIDTLCVFKECGIPFLPFICDKVVSAVRIADIFANRLTKAFDSPIEGILLGVCAGFDLLINEIDLANPESFNQRITFGESVTSVNINSDNLSLRNASFDTESLLNGNFLIAENQTNQNNASDINPEILAAMEDLIAQLQNFETVLQPSDDDGILEADETFQEMEMELTEIQEDGLNPLLTELRAYRNSYWRMTVGEFEVRGKTSSSGELNLPVVVPNTPYRLEIYEPQFKIIAVSEGVTASSGQQTIINPFEVQSLEGEVDTDSEGLADLAEQVVGTSLTNPDTDGDGINDLAEIQQGLDPLGGRGFPTGVISSLPLQGEARDIVVEGSPLDAEAQTAYVATGSHGLAIVDASQFDNPIVLGQVDLPGDNIDVAVDANLEIAAVAGQIGGLHLVNVSDPMLPTIIESLGFRANQVDVADGIVYATSGTVLQTYDLLTGEQIGSVGLADEADDLTVFRDKAYVLTESQLEIFDNTTTGLEQLSSIGVSGSPAPLEIGRRLFVDGELAYVGYFTGYSVIDVSDSEAPVIVGQPPATQAAVHDLVANGSGLVLPVTSFAGRSTLALSLYDGSDPTDVTQFITSIDTPGDARAVAVASGIAYVADDSGGLAVINYLPFDNQGMAPTVTIGTSADVDPNTSGIQVVEGSSISITADVVDDVQVRNVELLVNGEVVGNDVSFPFDLAAVAPNIAPGVNEADIQVRATDTGGNSTLSNVITLDLVEDTFAPEIVSTSPAASSRVVEPSSITVRFNEGIDTSLVSLSGLTLTSLGEDGVLGGGDDTSISLASVETPSNRRFVAFTEDAIEPGDYQFVVNPEIITDNAGNSLESPFTLEFNVRDTLIAFGESVSGTILTPDEQVLYTFNGAAGDGIALWMGSTSGVDPRIQIFGPDGTLLDGVAVFGSAAQLNVVLEQNGTYTVLVSDNQANDAGDYSVSLQRTNNPGNAIALGFGESASGTIDPSGELDTYTFNGTAGDGIALWMGSTSGVDPRIQIFGPDGTLLDGVAVFGSAAQLNVVLEQNGTYTVLVSDNQANDAGDYSVSLQRTNNPGNAIALGFGESASGTIDPSGELDTYTFNGTAGDGIALWMGSTSGVDPRIQIFGPDGTLLDGVAVFGSAAQLNVVLEQNGTYTVLVSDNQANDAGDYSVSLQRTNNPGNAIALGFGESASGTIDPSGELDTYTFNGTAGDGIALWMGSTSGVDPRIQIFGPDGTLLDGVAVFGSAAQLNVVLEQNGTYTVLVSDNQANDAGDYSVSLQRTNNPGNAIALGFGESASGTIDPSGELDTYTFNGTAGDGIALWMGSTSGVDPRIQIFGPDGTLLDGVAVFGSAAQLNVVLEQNGTYTVLVSDNQANDAGDYSVSLQRTNNPGNAIALGFGESASGTIDPSGELDTYTFNGTAGDGIALWMGSTSGVDPRIQIFGPDGTLLDGVAVFGSAAQLNVVLEQNGTYTVLVSDNQANDVGDYSVSVELT